MQELDNALSRLRHQREQLDAGDSARSERDIVQRKLDEQQAALNESEVARRAKEQELAQREEKLSKQNQRLMQAKSAHEVQSLERDIKALTAARSELDEAVLLLMEEGEELTAKVEELQNQLNEKQAAVDEIESTFASENQRIDAETKELTQAREQLVETIADAEFARYQKTADKHHGIAVSHLKNGACSACGTALTPFNLKTAQTEDWPTCESCRRFLYVEN